MLIFAAFAFCIFGGTILGSILGLIVGIFITVVMPLTFWLVKKLFRGVVFLVTFPFRPKALVVVPPNWASPGVAVNRRAALRRVPNARNRVT